MQSSQSVLTVASLTFRVKEMRNRAKLERMREMVVRESRKRVEKMKEMLESMEQLRHADMKEAIRDAIQDALTTSGVIQTSTEKVRRTERSEKDGRWMAPQPSLFSLDWDPNMQ